MKIKLPNRSANLTEDNFILYPASYNQKGLLGDFEVYVLEEGYAFSLSGRQGLYTSVEEWFRFSGKSILGKEPEYVLAMLKPGVDPSGKLSRASGQDFLLYRISREDAKNLEEIAENLEPLKDKQILVL